jgi:Sushi repeat (SCR repeat)
MIGSSSRTCIRSRWSGQKASCFGLNQDNDYASKFFFCRILLNFELSTKLLRLGFEAIVLISFSGITYFHNCALFPVEKPPTILFRHQNGPIAQSNDGKLIVYPGATVHMECLWMRRFGSPKWNVSQDYRKYPEGWSTDEGRDPQLEYRISIFHAVKDDSGVYTCTTPARHTHNVEVVVMAIHCNELVARRGLSLSIKETMMGSKVHFHCTNGNSLIGAHEVTCLPSGNWSAPLPVCESIECGEVPLTASMNGSTPRVAILSREVGGRAAFSCPLGYGLRGPSEAMCNTNGEWAGPFPTCVGELVWDNR